MIFQKPSAKIYDRELDKEQKKEAVDNLTQDQEEYCHECSWDCDYLNDPYFWSAEGDWVEIPFEQGNVYRHIKNLTAKDLNALGFTKDTVNGELFSPHATNRRIAKIYWSSIKGKVK